MKTQRRKFIKQSGVLATAAASAPGITLSGASREFYEKDKILQKLSELNDDLVEDLLVRQVNEPGEMTNLALQFPEIVNELKKQYETWLAEVKAKN